MILYVTQIKSKYYISFEVDDEKIKRVDRQDGIKRGSIIFRVDGNFPPTLF